MELQDGLVHIMQMLATNMCEHAYSGTHAEMQTHGMCQVWILARSNICKDARIPKKTCRSHCGDQSELVCDKHRGNWCYFIVFLHHTTNAGVQCIKALHLFHIWSCYSQNGFDLVLCVCVLSHPQALLESVFSVCLFLPWPVIGLFTCESPSVRAKF